jgi:uncharacterized protein YdcH (DUF465 family)
MYENRIIHLEEAHRSLDKQIDGLEKTGTYSDDHLNNLKKQRLHYRDEIAKLKRLQWEHDHETLDFEDDR